MKAVVTLHCLGALLLLLLPPKQGSEALPVTCCLKTSTVKVKVAKLERYIVQDKTLCPVRAVRFVTVRGTTICSDPLSAWAINAVEFLEKTHRP